MHSLDLKAVARSFGFAQPPRVNINIESKAAHTRKAQKGQGADYRRQKSGALGCAGSRGAHTQALHLLRRSLQRRLRPRAPPAASAPAPAGHSFSAANPYGQRQAGDNRQFVRV